MCFGNLHVFLLLGRHLQNRSRHFVDGFLSGTRTPMMSWVLQSCLRSFLNWNCFNLSRFMSFTALQNFNFHCNRSTCSLLFFFLYHVFFPLQTYEACEIFGESRCDVQSMCRVLESESGENLDLLLSGLQRSIDQPWWQPLGSPERFCPRKGTV